jgi:hypothetical protein
MLELTDSSLRFRSRFVWLAGFGDRLLNEVKKIALKDIKIKIYAPPERKYSTWIGGSILANLATFKKMWVSAEEYQEDPDIIHKKVRQSFKPFCPLHHSVPFLLRD